MLRKQSNKFHKFIPIEEAIAWFYISYGFSFGVSGMKHIWLVKVQPRVVTGKRSEPQAESGNAVVKEVV